MRSRLFDWDPRSIEWDIDWFNEIYIDWWRSRLSDSDLSLIDWDQDYLVRSRLIKWDLSWMSEI